MIISSNQHDHSLFKEELNSKMDRFVSTEAVVDLSYPGIISTLNWELTIPPPIDLPTVPVERMMTFSDCLARMRYAIQMHHASSTLSAHRIRY